MSTTRTLVAAVAALVAALLVAAVIALGVEPQRPADSGKHARDFRGSVVRVVEREPFQLVFVRPNGQRVSKP